MKVLIITGDRNAARYTPERERWQAAIEAVIDQTFGTYPGMIVTGTGTGISAIASDLVMNSDWSVMAGRVSDKKLILQARQLRASGMDVSVAVFHDAVYFSRSSRQVLEDARLHGFPCLTVTSHGHVERMVA